MIGNAAAPTITYPTIAWPYRFSFYAICSLYLEVVWTAIYELAVTGSLKMAGYSSIWSILIYGVVFAIIEQLYFVFLRHNFALPIRGLAYMLSIFAVELFFGLLLQPFDANSWDYSKQFTYHYRGLIALEYAPLWFVGGSCFEYTVDVFRRISYRQTDQENGIDVQAVSPKERQ